MAETSSLLAGASGGHSPTMNCRRSPRPNSLERQDSLEYMGSENHSLQSFESVESTEMSSLPVKLKKEKKLLSRMFRRKSPKLKDRNRGDHMDSVEVPLGVSLGTVETKKKFAKQKKNRTVHSSSYLTPPLHPKRGRARSHSNPNMMAGSDVEDLYSDGAHSDNDEFVATLLNPSLGAGMNRSRSNSSLLAHSGDSRPESALSTHSAAMESDGDHRESEPKMYNVLVTLHSGHNLAIRDRTGSSDPYVKVKCGQFKYRSAVIHRSLNPEWSETFSFRTPTLNTPMVFRVFDHDYGSLDDYMGGQSINLASYRDSEVHIVDLGLECPVAAAKGESLGSIRTFIQITPIYEGDSLPNVKEKRMQSKDIQVWDSIASVILLEAKDLPAMDDNGFSDPYCKLKLGSRKVKSKTIPKTLNPKWREAFGFKLFEGQTTLHIEVWDRDFPQSDDFIGSTTIDLSTLEKEKTHKLTLELFGQDKSAEESRGSVSVIISVTGTKCKESTNVDISQIAKNYSLEKAVKLRERNNVGYLRVRVDRGEDLPALDTGVVVQIGNAIRATQAVYRTQNPVWDRTFEFQVQDIHDEMNICLYKGSKKLSQFTIPLHRIQSGVYRGYALKRKNGTERAKGVIYLECELVYNPIRAAIRTINPKEQNMLEEEEKFNRKVLMNNISRVAQLIRTILATWQIINSFWSWEDKKLSACAFVIFVIACLFGEIWMFLLVGCLVFVYCYMVMYIRGKHLWQLQKHSSYGKGLSSTSSDESAGEGFSDFSDIEEDLNTNKGRTSLRAKLKQLQEILVIVQRVLGAIADMEERVRNLFNWSVPFLCWMAMCVLLAGSVLFYIVPLRYIILAWGINKFSKRLRNPNYISNNELLDFLSRSPTNKQLDQWHLLSVSSSSKSKQSTGNAKYKKQRSADVKDKKKR